MELVKAQSAAKATGLNHHFLYKAAAKRLLPHYRMGRAIRFSIPELLTWMRREANVNGSSLHDAGRHSSDDRLGA